MADKPKRIMATTRREILDDRIQIYRSDADKKPLLQRLNRIEGQVRGLRTMVESDRYCADELQQINAIVAALRAVGLLIVGQHVREGVYAAVEDGVDDIALADVMRILKAALRP